MLLQDTGTLLYTSGTTGRAKGVMVTHAMNLFNAINVTYAARISEHSVYLAVLPLFHTGGLNMYSNPVFHAGGTVIVMASFDPGKTLRALSDPTLGVTHYFGVPALYQFSAQHADFAATDLGRLKVDGVGGAPAPLALIETWQARGVMLTQAYGDDRDGADRALSRPGGLHAQSRQGRQAADPCRRSARRCRRARRGRWRGR
jgi:fatty-acyl-CoA synthase